MERTYSPPRRSAVHKHWTKPHSHDLHSKPLFLWPSVHDSPLYCLTKAVIEVGLDFPYGFFTPHTVRWEPTAAIANSPRNYGGAGKAEQNRPAAISISISWFGDDGAREALWPVSCSFVLHASQQPEHLKGDSLSHYHFPGLISQTSLSFYNRRVDEEETCYRLII